MKLKQYLEKHNINQASLARSVNMTKQFFNSKLLGSLRSDKKMPNYFNPDEKANILATLSKGNAEQKKDLQSLEL